VPQKTFKVSTIRTRGKAKAAEMTFEELRKDIDLAVNIDEVQDALSEQQSHRSFDFDETEEQIEVISTPDDEEVNEEEFRALRDGDDEDFPSAEALKKIPHKLIENGGLIFKGRKLMRLLSIFYNTTCRFCTTARRFRTVQGLFEHYKATHTEIEPFVTCCSMELKKMPKIIWHFVKHIEPDAFKCDVCDYAVSRPKFLAIHRLNHLPEGEKPLECDL
jgi:hypothetical protein